MMAALACIPSRTSILRRRDLDLYWQMHQGGGAILAQRALVELALLGSQLRWAKARREPEL